MCNPAYSTQIDKDIRQATIWRKIRGKKRRQISEKQKNESNQFLYHDKIIKKDVGDIFMRIGGGGLFTIACKI